MKSVCDCVIRSVVSDGLSSGWAGREAHCDDSIVTLAKSLESTGTVVQVICSLSSRMRKVRSGVARTCLCTVGHAVAAVVKPG